MTTHLRTYPTSGFLVKHNYTDHEARTPWDTLYLDLFEESPAGQHTLTVQLRSETPVEDEPVYGRVPDFSFDQMHRQPPPDGTWKIFGTYYTVTKSGLAQQRNDVYYLVCSPITNQHDAAFGLSVNVGRDDHLGGECLLTPAQTSDFENVLKALHIAHNMEDRRLAEEDPYPARIMQDGTQKPIPEVEHP